MNIFADAYKAGIDAGHKALENIEEINSVFEELDANILESSNGKITIRREEKTRKRRILKNISKLDGALGILGPEPYYEDEVTYDAIVVRNDEKKQFEIAEYEISEEGYPVTIKWSDRKESCWDKDALTSTLAELLSDVATGKVIIQLLSNQKIED